MDQENIKQEVTSSDNKNKKNKKNLIIIGVIIAILVVSYVVNGFSGKKSVERKAEKILESQLGGDVDINSNGDSVFIETKDGSFSAGESTKWPADMPSDIPEITFGKLTMVSSSSIGGQAWQVSVSDVTKSDYTSYHSSLLAGGWINTGMVSANIDVAQMSKGNYDLIIALNSEENTFVLTATVKQ
ncbi:MAG: hypothetical protein ABH951_02665 [Patescibacteria group bacterium]